MSHTTGIKIGEKEISFLGLGCVTFGREIDKNVSFELMDYAFQHGITFFDTAAVYGSGTSEMIVGEWLNRCNQHSEKIAVATKILPPYNRENIERSVDESLHRMRRDMIDLLYLHRWDASFESDQSAASLDRVVRNGKVKALGASNFSAGQLLHAVSRQCRNDLVKFQFAQNNHNLAVSEIGSELKEVCSSNGISLISYSPLGAGFLSGKYQHGLEPGSRFQVVPGHQSIYFNETAHRRLIKLLEVAARTGLTPAHLALAWAFHQPDIASVLVGARSTKHLEQAFSALAFDDPGIFAELEFT